MTGASWGRAERLREAAAPGRAEGSAETSGCGRDGRRPRCPGTAPQPAARSPRTRRAGGAAGPPHPAASAPRGRHAPPQRPVAGGEERGPRPAGRAAGPSPEQGRAAAGAGRRGDPGAGSGRRRRRLRAGTEPRAPLGGRGAWPRLSAGRPGSRPASPALHPTSPRCPGQQRPPRAARNSPT